MVLLALINLRGVGESVKFNVVLTLVELTGAADRHRGRPVGDRAGRRRLLAGSRSSRAPRTSGVFLAVTAATAVAFFAMVGFEDSVNMVEECQDPGSDLPAR